MKFSSWLILSALIIGVPAFSTETDAAAPISGEKPKVLDGVVIEAVENYPNPRSNEVGFGLGYYPFKSYYSGFSANLDYVHYLSKDWAWEVLDASAVFTVDTDLTTQLANKYSVNPSTIERLNATFSTNMMYVFTHGKLLFLDQYIRYFRALAIFGPGLALTNQNSDISVNLGIRIDAFVSETFSWKLEFRDMVAFNGLQQFASIMLGTGINF